MPLLIDDMISFYLKYTILAFEMGQYVGLAYLPINLTVTVLKETTPKQSIIPTQYSAFFVLTFRLCPANRTLLLYSSNSSGLTLRCLLFSIFVVCGIQQNSSTTETRGKRRCNTVGVQKASVILQSPA